MPLLNFLNLKSCFLIVVFSVSSAVCYGQDRPVRVLYYNAPATAPTDAFVYAGLEMVAETKLPRSNFSETFEIPRGDLQLRFLPAPLVDPNEMPEQLPFVNIPETWNKVLLMVFEDKSNPLMPISIKAIDASDNVFGPGSIYIVNFSSIGIFGTVGDKELKLSPKSIQILKDPINENGYYPAKLYSIAKRGDEPRRFVRQMWNHSDSIRRVLLVMPKETSPYASYYSTPIRDF